jgi:molybdopterin synthase sulfur carrier subunit
MTEKSDLTVKLATALARYTDNQKVIGCRVTDNDTLDALLARLDSQFAGLRAVICSGDSDIVDSINVYVNGDNVRYLQGLNTPLNNGDVINIIPAAAAG